MIIWLNGTFGAGKSATADRLSALVPGGRIFDPETVGQMLSANLSHLQVTDFQDWPAWRPLVATALAEVSKMTGADLIAPQTVLKKEYLEEIFAALRDAEIEVFHVVLDAAEDVLRGRIEGSAEAQSWRLAHLEEYRTARTWMIQAADLVVDTAGSTPSQIARQIRMTLPGLPPLPALRPMSAPPPRPAASSPDPAQADAGSTDAVQQDTEASAAQDRTSQDGISPESAATESAATESAATESAATDGAATDSAAPGDAVTEGATAGGMAEDAAASSADAAPDSSAPDSSASENGASGNGAAASSGEKVSAGRASAG